MQQKQENSVLKKKKRTKQNKTRRVFIFRIGDQPDAPCYIVRGANFQSVFGRSDVNMQQHKVQPMVDKLLPQFVRSPRSCTTIDMHEDKVIPDVHIVNENKNYDLYPVLIFLDDDFLVEESAVCQNLEKHDFSKLLLKRMRSLKKITLATV